MIGTWLDKQNYLRKLTLSSMLSTLFAIIAVIVMFVIVGLNYSRNEVVKNLQSMATVVGTNARAAISFDDPDFAAESLLGLSKQDNVILANIYLPQNETLNDINEQIPFATYLNPKRQDEAVTSYSSGFSRVSNEAKISKHEIIISEPVFLDNEVVASITLRASMQPFYDTLKSILAFSLLVLVLAGLFSYLIWKMSQRIWAAPFLRFSSAIRTVTNNKDYSKRIRVTSKDELGDLIEGFNGLMSQIQTQQIELLSQQSSLEDEVVSRTQALTHANRKLIDEVTERSITENNLLKLTSAVTQADEAVIITNNEGYIEYVNPSFERVTGYSASHATGKKPSLLKSDSHDEAFFIKLWETLAAGETYKGVFINTRPNGDNYHLEQSITPVFNDQMKIINYVATGRDISERIQTQAALQHMAHHDALTNLPNRSLLSDRIDQAINRATRENSEIAVMFIDLDGFKLVNDMYGHEAGDTVLKNVASRICSTVRTQDTVSRISGDEFAVVLEDMQNISDAGIVARKILDALSLVYDIGQNEVYVTASIGISVYPGDGNNTRDLLKRADQAMYSAKRDGKARYYYYSKDENNLVTERLKLEHQLIRAVKEKQFVLHYQPLMHAKDNGIHGVEALIRWQHPKDGLVYPDNFIHLLESSGMINEVGAWVMEEACMQLSRWHNQGEANLLMSVNISPKQLEDKQFLNYLINALQVSGIEPQFLELEITENMFLAMNEQNVRILNSIADLGVQIAIDDFGMGHSSLSYISKLKISTLKIDRSFINEMAHSPENSKIVSALIGLAERLNISVTAEGVETMEQLQLLEDLNCTYAQGWLFAKAMPAEEFENWSHDATKKLQVLTDETLLNFVDNS